MTYFRHINRQSLLLWSVLLSLSLVCTQIVGLHYHSLDHDLADHLIHDSLNPDIGIHDLEKSHVNGAHSALDGSHVDHHDGAATVDISPDGWLKNTSKNTFSIDIIVLMFVFSVLIAGQKLTYRLQEKITVPDRQYTLSPPLRAPPAF